MSMLTDRLYRQWRACNAPDRGMGGVPPMKAQQMPAKPAGRGHPAPLVKGAASRPEKPL